MPVLLVAAVHAALPSSTATAKVAIPGEIPSSETSNTTSNPPILTTIKARTKFHASGQLDAVAIPSRLVADTSMKTVLKTGTSRLTESPIARKTRRRTTLATLRALLQRLDEIKVNDASEATLRGSIPNPPLAGSTVRTVIPISDLLVTVPKSTAKRRSKPSRKADKPRFIYAPQSVWTASTVSV